MIRIMVQPDPFDSALEEAMLRKSDLDIGATVSFTGYVRGEGDSLASMTLEHYPGMTERQLADIAERATDRWPLNGLTVIHRYGTLEPGDPIVLVIAASRHRTHAFEAASFVMDFLKSEAPFWKKERSNKGEHWVEARKKDEDALDRWS